LTGLRASSAVKMPALVVGMSVGRISAWYNAGAPAGVVVAMGKEQVPLSQQAPPPSKNTTSLLTVPRLAQKWKSALLPGALEQVGVSSSPPICVARGVSLTHTPGAVLSAGAIGGSSSPLPHAASSSVKRPAPRVRMGRLSIVFSSFMV
jgi:hypothetical protein